MKKEWKIIKSFDYNDISSCIEDLKSKKVFLSEWIIDVFRNYELKIKKNEFPIRLYRISLKELGLNKPTTLKEVYKNIEINNFKLVEPEISLICRLHYKEQTTGEWLRFATPFQSLIDSDGVPHLPKLGKALGKYFIETYWSYPDAIFHPHNEFVVKK